MRIQHNIMAMNSYRNYNNNASALSKNLEKLSSGYKINRAGDDAAGLAISEKMRAQIKGLEAAQKNVKDGISLVKTAEGAMQEIQDMLSRMKYLATQSSNGTYDDSVDRNALQDEVDALRDEINRIADSANFNGINLLDGSMAAGGSSSGSRLLPPTVDGFDLQPGTVASKGKVTITPTAVANIGPGAFSVTVELNGKSKTYTYNIVATSGGKALKMLDDAGKEVKLGSAGSIKVTAGGTVTVSSGATISVAEFSKNLVSKLKADFGDNFGFTITAGGEITATAKTAGVDACKTGSIRIDYTTNANVDTHTITGWAATTPGVDPDWTVAATKFSVAKASELADKTYTINGVKFAFMSDDYQINAAQANNPNLHIIKVDAAEVNNGKLQGAALDKFALAIKNATGLDVTADGTNLKFYGQKSVGTGTKGGLQLQIGDTADSFNQMQVKIGDMHTSALGIHGINIGTIDGAANAIDKIKTAINTVSSVRGTLGAVQNRLEHTKNNLSVMTENITDAESTIRDTDVADEMMAYTKNNILIQSAQAMLAQANSVPQGVLQLLQ